MPHFISYNIAVKEALLMKKGFYVTISEIERYYGNLPFKAGEIVKISKDKGNGRARYIRVTLPMLGTVGYIAKGGKDIAGGTLGSEKIYDKIGKSAYALIMFVTDSKIVAKILLPKDVERTPYLRAYRIKQKVRNKRL